MSQELVAFDDVRKHVGDALDDISLPDGAPPIYVVRDLFGKVSLAVPEAMEDDDDFRNAVHRLAGSLHDRLGAHGRPIGDFVLWVDPELLSRLDGAVQEMRPGVKLADRLMVGGNWWTANGEENRKPVRYTLYSVKGGVGRSTTAAVLAWHLARRGEDVLAIDLDLESPGLASTLVGEEGRPDFGVTDWFVEDLVGQSDLILDKIVGQPLWARQLSGTVWVAPAHGRDPGEYLAKLGRAYMDTAEDPWTSRLRRLVTGLEERLSPTVVILESRSGLHDIAAATVTDIGAQVLLFAVDAPAAWTGYRILFEHWRDADLAARLRERLSIVCALTPHQDRKLYLARFREKSWDLFRDGLYDPLAGTEATPDAVSYALAEEDAPHSPLVINWDPGLAAGTSLRHIEESTLQNAYQPFLRRFDELDRALAARAGAVDRRGSAAIAHGTATLRLRVRPAHEQATNKSIETFRIALSRLPRGTSHGDAPAPSRLYLPPSHRKALDPDVLLVTGMRGSGKTFWWAALQDRSLRTLLNELHPRLGPVAESDVLAGFGVGEEPDHYPGRDEIRDLIAAGVKHQMIWRTVHALAIASKSNPLSKLASWQQRADYVARNPGAVAHLFREHDAWLDDQGRYSLILFDALDRSADDWSASLSLIRGLLQHALDMRAYRRLRAKVFLRSDQVKQQEVADFADASKVLSSEVELTWHRRDLYGMLWQYLGNDEEQGEILRPRIVRGHWHSIECGNIGVHLLPPTFGTDEEEQRDTFHEVVSGPWMGTDHRRGFPYTWIPNHLADAGGRVSPRSFIAALRAAAEDTAEHHPDHDSALHYDSIKRGVQRASQIRVQELGEDYPWVHRLLQALVGVVVPCEFEAVKEAWGKAKVLDQLSEEVQRNGVKLLPPKLQLRAFGVREDLESLGVFRRLVDGRVDVPDVFRVGYGIGRKGGVRPMK